jgi:uncharacterized phage-associated protein
MPAPYTASQIAKWLLGAIDRESGDSVTHLKLQKLIFYAQAWSLALPGRGYPLFDEDLQAWAHGPVAESVFHEYKTAGWEALPAPDEVHEISEEDEAHLREILSVFGEFSAKHLERMTHSEGPWLMARGGLAPEARSNAIIPKGQMASYYGELYEQAENGEQ